METHTIRLFRVLKASPDAVYRAFLEADALAKWIPPYGYVATVHALDARVGGRFRMSFRCFATGESHAFGGEYKELVPGQRLRYTDVFDSPELAGEIEVLVTLKAVGAGTQLEVVQSGVPAVIPADMCHLGWQDSLVQLARLVEAPAPSQG